jgi:hypothetical protein
MRKQKEIKLNRNWRSMQGSAKVERVDDYIAIFIFMPCCCFNGEVPGGGASVVQFVLSTDRSASDFSVTPKPAGNYRRVSTVVSRLKFLWAQQRGSEWAMRTLKTSWLGSPPGMVDPRRAKPAMPAVLKQRLSHSRHKNVLVRSRLSKAAYLPP